MVENVKKVLVEHVNPVDEDDEDTSVDRGRGAGDVELSMTRRDRNDDEE
jgi:hypothetical protein